MRPIGGKLRNGRALTRPPRKNGKPFLATILSAPRPLSSLVVGTLTAAAAASGNSGFTLRGIEAGLAMTFLAAFGFIANDLFDYHKDRAAGVRRPIATGALSRTGASWLAVAMLLCTALLSGLVGVGWLLVCATAVLLLLYSPIAERFPLCKDAYVAAMCCAPLCYGATAVSAQFPWTSYAALTCFVLGREVLMDAAELPGDRSAGMRTIALVLGPNRTAGVGQGLMLLAATALPVIVHGSLAKSAAVVTLFSLIWVFAWPGLDPGRRIGLSRFPMLLGSLALASAGV